MNTTTIKTLLFSCLTAGLAACSPTVQEAHTDLRYEFGNILNITLTPDSTVRRAGCFTDAGSWMGFTIPQADKWGKRILRAVQHRQPYLVCTISSQR